jgi:hypothetical protein
MTIKLTITSVLTVQFTRLTLNASVNNSQIPRYFHNYWMYCTIHPTHTMSAPAPTQHPSHLHANIHPNIHSTCLFLYFITFVFYLPTPVRLYCYTSLLSTYPPGNGLLFCKLPHSLVLHSSVLNTQKATEYA